MRRTWATSSLFLSSIFSRLVFGCAGSVTTWPPMGGKVPAFLQRLTHAFKVLRLMPYRSRTAFSPSPRLRSRSAFSLSVSGIAYNVSAYRCDYTT